MTQRVCPECDARTTEEICRNCGCRTLVERRKTDLPDPLIGRVFENRYRLDALIGRGGMGAVYRGVQLATMQTVAVKVIRAEHAEDTAAAKRFHREARAASQLTHPHTIRVFDFGQSEDGDLYMVLEYLKGRTLSKARKEEGRFDERRVAGIACEVSQSLLEAHAAGLAHRDLKPENVMLLDTPGHPDFVKVLDFGIAKFLSGSSDASSVTRSGAVVGTPQYMAPEQARRSPTVTPAVDVYSLGICVYESLAGARPFDGDSAVGILMAHVREPVPELPGDCPVSPEMRALLRRMLAKDPSARPMAAELVVAFDRIRTTAPVTVSTAASMPVSAAAPAVDGDGETLQLSPGTAISESALLGTTGAMPLEGAGETVAMEPPARHTLATGVGRGQSRWLIAVAIGSVVALAAVLVAVFYPVEDGTGAGPAPEGAVEVSDDVTPEDAGQGMEVREEASREPVPPPEQPEAARVPFRSDLPGARVLPKKKPAAAAKHAPVPTPTPAPKRFKPIED